MHLLIIPWLLYKPFNFYSYFFFIYVPHIQKLYIYINKMNFVYDYLYFLNLLDVLIILRLIDFFNLFNETLLFK